MNKFKLALVSAAVAALLVPAAAQAQLSFNIGAVSLYKSSGVDQNYTPGKNSKNFSPAVQGGVDYEFGNGFYVGNWNSTGKFDGAEVEIDLYGGYRGEITKGLGYDISMLRYVYPSAATGWNGNELAFVLSYDAFSAKITRGFQGSLDEKSRLSFGYTRPLTEKLTLKAGLGFRNKKAGDFNDYSVGVSYDLGSAMTASATLSGATDKVADGSRDNRLVLGVSKSF